MDPKILRVILATDCGSTTTKAILIQKVGDEYRQTYRGEAPTTVEAPFEDVTRGVLNAIQEVEELSGRRILEGEKIITPANGNAGVDIYISTSSAGGGLQMMVTGVVKAMTAESAQRCALGAGAIVMDVLASNDGRPGHEKIERIRYLRPDMILLSGGTDGGTVSHVVELGWTGWISLQFKGLSRDFSSTTLVEDKRTQGRLSPFFTYKDCILDKGI